MLAIQPSPDRQTKQELSDGTIGINQLRLENELRCAFHGFDLKLR
jgi:hypothetical protein